MKNNLFRKFLALFLTGAMLTGVGCKDYDGDIDDINKRLEGLEGTVALKTDLTSINESIQKLEAIDHGAFLKTADFQSKFDAALTAAKVASKDDIKNFLTSDEIKTLIGTYGFQTAKDVKDLISENTLKEADVKGIFNQMIATQDAYNAFQSKVLADIQTKLAAWTLNDTQMNAIKSVMATALADEDGAFRTSINQWLGKDFEKYMVEYMKGDAFKSASSDAAIAAINGQIGDAQKSLVENLNKMIDDAIAKNDNAYLQIADLTTEFGTYTETISKLAGRIAELEGRIQSLVWVPKSLMELEENEILVRAADYIYIDGAYVPLAAAKAQTIEVTYRVSPAALASKIKKENLQFVAEELTRAEGDILNITEVKDADPQTGKFTVVAETTYQFLNEDNLKTLAFALNVKMAGASEAQGIDYTSAYVGMYPIGASSINRNLVIARQNADKTYTVLAASTYNSTLAYTNTDPVTFLKDFDVYYMYEDEAGETVYEKAAERWTDLSVAIVAPTANATVSGNATSYTLTKTTAAIKTSDVKLIGDKITSKQFAFNVKAGDKTLSTKVDEVITVVGNDTAVAAVAPATVAWTYAIASANDASKNVYTTTDVTLESGKISAATFKALADADLVTVAAPEDAVVFATLAQTSTPSADSDVQKMNVTLTGGLKISGTYTVKAVYTLADKNTVTVTIPVTVTGMPVLPEVTIPAADFTYAGVSREFLLLSKYAESIWSDSYKPAFASKDEFVGAIEGANHATNPDGKATIAIVEHNFNVVFDADAAYDVAYKPSIKFTNATGLSVTFKTAGVTLKDPGAELVRVDNFFGADDKALAKTEFPTASTFRVVDKDLNGAYKYTGSIPNTTIEYSLDNTQFGNFAGTKPVITNNKLIWNEWNQLEVTVTVQLKAQDGTVLSTKSFIVKINDPVAAAITLAAKKATISLDSANKTVDVVASMTMKETISASANKNIFHANGDLGAHGLDTDLKAALTGDATYTLNDASFGEGGLEKKYFSIDEKGLVTTTLDPSLVLLKDQEILVTVKYTYQFGVRTVNVPVVITK